MFLSETSGRRSGSSPALAEWMQEKLDNILRETGITAVCAAVCAEGELLAAACAGTRGFEDSEARVDSFMEPQYSGVFRYFPVNNASPSSGTR